MTTDTLTTYSPAIVNIAKEMASEARCIGFTRGSWDDCASERKDAWCMIAIAAILAMRDEVGFATVDRILAPRPEGA